MPKASRRQHFIARFYLRNFAEPVFSDNLRVFDLRARRWERRSPDGVGWFPHLLSRFDLSGQRLDDFDQFLKRRVEDPAAPALKRLAADGVLEESQRDAIALFIALTAARSPEVMDGVIAEHLDGLSDEDRAELDSLVERWCSWIGKPFDLKSRKEFMKPGSFGAIWGWSQSLRDRLLQWQWHVVRTTRDKPFVTSDRPVFAQWDRDQDIRLVTFPASSEFAIVIISGGQLNQERASAEEVFAMNLQTMQRAKSFIVACKEAFPGDDHLASDS